MGADFGFQSFKIVPSIFVPSSLNCCRAARAASRVGFPARITVITLSAMRPNTRASGICSMGGEHSLKLVTQICREIRHCTNHRVTSCLLTCSVRLSGTGQDQHFRRRTFVAREQYRYQRRSEALGDYRRLTLPGCELDLIGMATGPRGPAGY
jgi:hypothetical protein